MSLNSLSDLIVKLALTPGMEAPPEHRTHVVLVASPEMIEEARTYIGKGVDTVLSAAATAEESARVLYVALGAAPRASVRVPVRVEAALGEGPSLVYRQTENLSATGMLVRAPRALPVGMEVSFRLDLPRAGHSLEGRAVVVRHVFAADQAVVATGLRFVSFRGDDDERLRSFVESKIRSKGPRTREQPP